MWTKLLRWYAYAPLTAHIIAPETFTDCTLPYSQAANGLSAMDAWLQCGQPRGRSGIQNIRKRARELKAQRELAAAPPTRRRGAPAATTSPILAVAEAEEAPQERSSKKKQPAFRLRPDQVQKAATTKLAMKEAYEKVYADATAEWSALFLSGRTGKGDFSSEGVARRFNEQLPPGCPRRLSGKILRNRVNEGKAGERPGQRGPPRDVPLAFVKGLADYAQMQQLAGNEQKPRQLHASIVAAAKGTIYEASLAKPSQKASVLRRMRVELGLGTVSSQVIDDRRWKWLTSSNLTTWFSGYVKTLQEWGFIESVPDDNFEIITIERAKAIRMLNADESHQKLSNEGETSGPRSKVYINEKLGRAGKRKVSYQKHATILVWVLYGGEVGAPHMMLATDAQAAKKGAAADADTSTIRIRPEWMFGIPRVQGAFGLAPGSQPKIFEPSYVLNEKGGMSGGGLQEFVEMQIQPAYPTMAREWQFDDAGFCASGPVFAQLDAGPDRYTECSLTWRAKMWDAGLCLFPGLPNGTACNQVCDDLFGTYKAACDDQIDNILSERILENKKDPMVKVKIDFCDLGRVINGVDGDPVEKRPFMHAFAPSKIVNSVANLGLNPVDLRKALAHKRVRDDSMDGARATEVTAVHAAHVQSRQELANLGFNSDALDLGVEAEALVVVESATVAGPGDYETAWNAIKAAGGCAGAHWAAVGAKAFNAPEVVGPALEKVQERVAEKEGRVAKKVETFNELRKAAREILHGMDEEGEDYGDLCVADLKALISYVFQAEQKTGVGKVSTNKATCVEYLQSLHDGHVASLVDNPPLSAPTSVATGVVTVQPLLQLTGPTVPTVEAVVLSAFAEIQELAPDGLEIVESPPEWLAAELAAEPSAESQLVDRFILYKWPARLGSWLVGKLSPNTNKKQRVGDLISNYKAFYAADGEIAYHNLTFAAYAKGSNSKVDSWVLLG